MNEKNPLEVFKKEAPEVQEANTGITGHLKSRKL